MKLLLKILLILSIVALIFSCSDSLGIEEIRNETKEKALIKPLNLDNFWAYKVIAYDYKSDFFDTSSVTHRIIDENTIGNTTWYTEEQVYPNSTVSAKFANDNDGLWRDHGTPDFNPNKPYMIVDYPAYTNKSILVNRYTLQGKVYEIYRTPVNVKVMVDVPGGRFRCIKYIDRLYEFEGDLIADPLNALYYSPNYGMIKREKYSRDADNNSIIVEIWLLDDFKIITRGQQ